MAKLLKASVLLASVLTVIGCARTSYYGSAPYDSGYGDVYYDPPPQNIYAAPWVGANSPWVFYQGDWFLNGVLYYFYGDRYGWAPYYAYPYTYVVRPYNWYAPKWNTWYQRHPQYVQIFIQRYPYWRSHRHGHRYDQKFYERYHRGQGEGWQKGFHRRAMDRPQPEGRRPAPAQVAPREQQRPEPTRVSPSEGWRPGSNRVTPRESRRPAPAQVTPREQQRFAPPQASPQEGQRSGPARVAPTQERRRPGPVQVSPREEKRTPGTAVTPREMQRGSPVVTQPE